MKKYFNLSIILLVSNFICLSAQNLITNSGFEAGMNSWNFSASIRSKATSQIVTDTKNGGAQALKIQVDTIGLNKEDIRLTSAKFKIVKASVYSLSFWAKCDSLNYIITAVLTDTSNSGFKIIDKSEIVVSKGTTNYTVQLIAPANTDYVKLSILINSKGTIYFDDFSISSKNKTWYEGANDRIEKIRKGNFSIKVLNKDGNVVSDSVKIEMINHEFPFGNFISATSSDWEKSAMLKFYNSGVDGNEFKWSGIEPNMGILNYAPFDSTLAWTQKVGWPLKGHTLLWNGHAGNAHEVPSWVQALPKDQMNDSCKLRIQREMKRYKGLIKEYDVMNEPSHTTFLSTHIGDSIFWNSFKWAREADSTAQLFMNDYNLIEYDESGPFMAIVNNCLAHGAPIDGIGIQGHFGPMVGVEELKTRLDKCAAAGLQLRITEFDFDVTAQGISQKNQAIYIAQVLRSCFSYPLMTGFYSMGIVDPNVFRAGAGLFDESNMPKIAADTVYNLLHKEWSTNIIGKTSENGTFPFRAFYGTYEISAKIGDSTKVFFVKCIKANDEKEFILKASEGAIPSPKLIKVTVSSTTNVEMTFDKEMADPSNEINNFMVFDQTANPIKKAELKSSNSKIIVLTIGKAVKAANRVTVSYMPGNQKAADNTKLSMFNHELAENIVPGVQSASTTNDGTGIELTFNRNMNDPSSLLSNFIIKEDGVADTIAKISLKNGLPTVVVIELTKPVVCNSNITLTYKPGNLSSTEGLPIAAIGLMAIQNKRTCVKITDFQPELPGLYPNPVENNLQFVFLNGIKSITISSILGQEVAKLDNLKSDKLEFDMSRFEKGVYLVNFKSLKNTSKVIKLIKK
jgi:uncharacterized repeat protein (TIGR02059 family)